MLPIPVSAFFGGADAVILSFDVKQHATLRALNYQWSEFCECRPLSGEDGDEDDEVEEYCPGVVGNKTDIGPVCRKSQAASSENCRAHRPGHNIGIFNL